MPRTAALSAETDRAKVGLGTHVSSAPCAVLVGLRILPQRRPRRLFPRDSQILLDSLDSGGCKPLRNNKKIGMQPHLNGDRAHLNGGRTQPNGGRTRFDRDRTRINSIRSRLNGGFRSPVDAALRLMPTASGWPSHGSSQSVPPCRSDVRAVPDAGGADGRRPSGQLREPDGGGDRHRRQAGLLPGQPAGLVQAGAA